MTEAEELELLELEALEAEAAAPKKSKTTTVSGFGPSIDAIMKGLAQTKGGAAAIGAGRAGANLWHGGGQLITKALGDEEELGNLQNEEEIRRAKYKELVSPHPTSANVGEIGGAVIPALAAIPFTGGGSAAPVAAAAARSLPSLLRAGAGAAARTAGTAATGAGMGAAAPLTQSEEASGERGKRALIGGAVGAAIPGITAMGRGAKELGRLSGRQLPEEAVQGMVERLGYRGTAGQASDALRQAVRGEKNRLTGEFNAGYSRVEGQVLPDVTLEGTNQALSSLTGLSDEIAATKSPALARLMGRIQSATDDIPSQILGPNGTPIGTTPKPFSFKDVRESRRALKEMHRNLLKSNKTQEAAKVSNAISALDDDLAKWETKHGTGALTEATQMDEAYASQLAPFSRDQLGRYLRSDTTTPNLLSGTREVTQDVVNRVPGAVTPMRVLLGEKAALRPKTLAEGSAEVLLTPQERQYAIQLVQALRNEGPPGALDKILKALPGGRAERIIAGVEEMGYTVPGSPGYLRNVAYSAGLSNVATED